MLIGVVTLEITFRVPEERNVKLYMYFIVYFVSVVVNNYVQYVNIKITFWFELEIYCKLDTQRRLFIRNISGYSLEIYPVIH